MKENHHQRGKDIVTLIACSYLINMVGTRFKTDTQFYKHKNKNMLNNLLASNMEVIRNHEGAMTLIKKQPEGVMEEFTDQIEGLINMIVAFSRCIDEKDTSNFYLIARELSKKNTCYTKEDLIFWIRRGIEKLTNIKPTDQSIESLFV